MISITTQKRNKGESKPGFIKGVFYGAHAASTPIFIQEVEFLKAYREAGESTMIHLKGEGVDENVMIQDVTRDPVKGGFTHIDFYVVEKGQKVHVKLPINFVDEAPAAKLGANIVKVMHELSVEADPATMPSSLNVSLSTLVDLNSNVHVSDIKLPAGVSLYHVEPTEVVASAVAQVEEDLSAAPTTVDMNAIAVEEKGKKEVTE